MPCLNEIYHTVLPNVIVSPADRRFTTAASHLTFIRVVGIIS